MATKATRDKRASGSGPVRMAAKKVAIERTAAATSTGQGRPLARGTPGKSARLMQADVNFDLSGAQTLDALSDQFQKLSEDVATYAHTNVNNLPREQFEDLFDQSRYLAGYASKMRNAAGLAYLSNLPIDAIGKSITAMNVAISNLQKLGNVFDIVASAVNLGVAIITKNPGQIVATLAAAKHLLQESGGSDTTVGSS